MIRIGTVFAILHDEKRYERRVTYQLENEYEYSVLEQGVNRGRRADDSLGASRGAARMGLRNGRGRDGRSYAGGRCYRATGRGVARHQLARWLRPRFAARDQALS